MHPARLDQLVPMPKPAAVIVKNGKRVPVKTQPTYVLEVIQGTQKTVHKFGTGDKETEKQ
jgi:hypothetical protein